MNQQPHMPMLMPIMPPMWQQAQAQQPDEYPPRIRAAMEMLAMLSLKTMTKAACIDQPGGIEMIPGQKLTGAESHLQFEACKVLEKYFAGSLEPDWRESNEHENNRIVQGPHILVNCPACFPNPAVGCKLCTGIGKVFVTPARENGG